MRRVVKITAITLVIGMIVGSIVQMIASEQFRKNFFAAKLKNSDDISEFWPRNALDIEERTALYQDALQEKLDRFLRMEPLSRTYANTVQALDRFLGLSDLAIWMNILALFEQVSPDKAIRDAAHKAIKDLQAFFIDNFTGNKKVYQALLDYERVGHTKGVNVDQDYALQEMLDGYFRLGLCLADQPLEQVKALRKEIDELSLNFEVNISNDQSAIEVDKDALAGLSDEYINSLTKTDDGKYKLGVDYPTYAMVMHHCTVENTRRLLFLAFTNRAFPANQELLNNVAGKRDELAKLIGFKTFAHLDIDGQMARTPEIVEKFLQQLFERSKEKEAQELALLLDNLPEGVTLTDDGKIKPWDGAFVKESYKKKHFSLDDRVIAEYFPLDQTIDKLLSIYSSFLSLSFEKVPCEYVWHPDVQILKVANANGSTVYGYLFLDLHPRPNKFSHAAHFTLVPAMYCAEIYENIPGFSAVVANFPKAQGHLPALLKFDDVKTFFHEFGHALHAMLGITPLATMSGTSVKWDFVEMPSQMLEEWLYDAQMLAYVSSHYKTGEPLRDDVIQKLVDLKQFDTGSMIQRQIVLAFYSLLLFSGKNDPYSLNRELYAKYRPSSYHDPEDHFYAAFGHLMGYGAKYYSYLWSKVFALDLFEYIKATGGLLNSATGKRYVQQVIGKGGSKDPNELLEDFLGRKPNQNAFLASLGFAQAA